MEKKHKQLKNLTAYSLFIGILIGMSGNVIQPGTLQNIAWGMNAFFIIIGASLLSLKLTRLDHDIPAAGFGILTIGNAMAYGFLATHDAGSAQFGASIFIYVPALFLISLSDLSRLIIRIIGMISAAAFAILAVRIFIGISDGAINDSVKAIAYAAMSVTELAWGWWVYNNKE